jgi:hypothetical protein
MEAKIASEGPVARLNYLEVYRVLISLAQRTQVLSKRFWSNAHHGTCYPFQAVARAGVGALSCQADVRESPSLLAFRLSVVLWQCYPLWTGSHLAA